MTIVSCVELKFEPSRTIRNEGVVLVNCKAAELPVIYHGGD